MGTHFTPPRGHQSAVVAQLRQPFLSHSSLKRVSVQTPLINSRLKSPSGKAGKYISSLLLYSKALVPSLHWIPGTAWPANTDYPTSLPSLSVGQPTLLWHISLLDTASTQRGQGCFYSAVIRHNCSPSRGRQPTEPSHLLFLLFLGTVERKMKDLLSVLDDV